MKVLLSIKPKYAERIFDGTKRFEFRRNIYRSRNIRTIAVYATRPVCMIVGEFDVDGILCEESPDALWDLTSDYAGISREHFDTYFLGRDRSFAIVIAAFRVFDKPINPSDLIDGFMPPQSFMYVSDEFGRPRPSQLALAL